MLISLADVQRATGLPRYIVNYAIDRYGPEPSGRVGITRVWDEEDLPRIMQSIERTRGRCGRQPQATTK